MLYALCFMLYTVCIRNANSARVSVVIPARTGRGGREKSKRDRKLHDRHGQGFESDMFFPPVCEMHRGKERTEKLQWMASLERFAQSRNRIRGLEGRRHRMLSRKGFAIKTNKKIRRSADFLFW